jgi:hypothetical protein
MERAGKFRKTLSSAKSKVKRREHLNVLMYCSQSVSQADKPPTLGTSLRIVFKFRADDGDDAEEEEEEEEQVKKEEIEEDEETTTAKWSGGVGGIR